MAKELIMENGCAMLWYHPESKIVHHEIKNYAYGKNLQDILSKGSEVLKIKGAKKWLSDDRKNNALTKEDTEWCTNVWFPNTVKNGWKYWAIVQPAKLIGQMNIKRFAEIYEKQGVIVNFFSDLDEALEWLMAQ